MRCDFYEYPFYLWPCPRRRHPKDLRLGFICSKLQDHTNKSFILADDSY